MEITRKEIEHLAKLSRLEFGEQELETFTAEFKGLLDQMALISDVDTSKVDLKNVPINAETDLRADKVGVSLKQAEVLANAPCESDGAFLVPATVE